MATNKLKLTGFARFFLVMLILAPLAFFGASYYNGEDGIAKIKALFSGKENTEVVTEQPQPATETEINAEVARLRDELSTKTQKLEELYKRNAELEKQLKDQAAELVEVKAQLDKIKSAVGQ